MKRFLTAIILTSILGFTATASAKTHDEAGFTSAELARMCSSAYDTDYGYCAGYISAVANTLTTESVAGYRACNFGMAKSQQFVDIYRSYASTFQDQMGSDANAGVAAALARAFPCDNQGG